MSMKMKLVDKELSKHENWYHEPENPPKHDGVPKNPQLQKIINETSMKLYGKPAIIKGDGGELVYQEPM